MAPVYWLIAFVIFTGIEIATLALTTIWFAGGAIAAFLLSLAGAGLNVQLIAFVAVSFILLFMTRPFISRHINSKTVKTNSESLIGKQARVTAEINNEMGTGTAVVNGQEWTARAVDDADIYPVGTLAVINEIQGVKLILKKENGGE